MPCCCGVGTGACCAEDGSCSITTEAECIGVYQGDGTVCDPNPCPSETTGACCCGPPCCSEIPPFSDGEEDERFWITKDTDCDGNVTYSNETTADALFKSIVTAYGNKCDPDCVDGGPVVLTCRTDHYYSDPGCHVASTPDCDIDCNRPRTDTLLNRCNDSCFPEACIITTAEDCLIRGGTYIGNGTFCNTGFADDPCDCHCPFLVSPFPCTLNPSDPNCYQETTCGGECTGMSFPCDDPEVSCYAALRDVSTCCEGSGTGNVCVSWYDPYTCVFHQTLNGVEGSCDGFCDGDAEHRSEDIHYCCSPSSSPSPSPFEFAQRIAELAGY